jgi:ribonuclease P/MRP protein subunit POP1
MSHNRYRIPVRLRKSLETDLIKNESMQKMPKCRKNIRKRHRLMLSYKMRSDKCKWLSTHMWAAKRMRMCKYGGYKIAESPNNKSFRSAYRSFRSNSCLIDYSYMSCMTIEQVSENLSAFILPQEIRLKNGGRQVDEVDRLYQG